MKAGEPLTSATNRDFAQRAYAVLESQGKRLGTSTILVMGKAFHTSASQQGFDSLSGQVTNYIQSVIEANASTLDKGCDGDEGGVV